MAVVRFPQYRTNFMGIKIITRVSEIHVQNTLVKMRACFSSSPVSGIHWEQYLTMLQQPAIWADHVCVAAVASAILQ